VAELVEQIAGALDYLHGEGIIHRDLKPNNLVFDEHDNIYLADLGIAKILNDAENAALTMVGQAIGTPYYMPPEQWLGGQITPAADQYALACIVHRLLTGELPFQGETPYTMMLRHVRDDPPALSSRCDDLPNSLDAVLARALAKDADDRFASAGAFAEAFQSAAQGERKAPVQLPGSGHVFISYSRSDGDYAYRLADRIRAAGCEVWIDSRLEPADSWWRVIVDAVEGCAAFISIMSPAALDSKWVEREILLADRHNKPAFPLLLGGEPFPIYVGTQYMDVRAGTLPPDPFFARLSQVVSKRPPAARATPEDSVA
jgi:serine/threonine protein kinase